MGVKFAENKIDSSTLNSTPSVQGRVHGAQKLKFYAMSEYKRPEGSYLLGDFYENFEICEQFG